ncbi:MAG: epimerase [Candidatus Rokuibacteriota bacterium]|nr:MAG: epimerase [Candidatus Rokubacteria bacterium]
MTVLVTGGCGFIGSNLVRRLAARGVRLRLLDNLSVGTRDALPAGSAIDLIVGDIRDVTAVTRAVEGVDAVVHLAASTGVSDSVSDPASDFDANVMGTFNLLRASVAASVRRFVFASSNAAIGEHPPPVDELRVPRPISPYGAGKLAGEGYCAAFAAAYGLQTFVLRFSNVVARFIREGLQKGAVTVYGDGRQTRDFLYVEDLCTAVEAALAATGSGEVFQIASGIETTVLTLVTTLKTVSGRDFDVVFAPARTGDIARNVSDISKATRLLGYRPVVPLEDGLRRTCDWFLRR